MTDKPATGGLSLGTERRALRRGDVSPAALVGRLQARFEALEPAIQAFLPEEHRFQRLRADADGLEAQYPEPSHRPPLYGALLGVKDIFHVDGFATQAGTRVPPECFAGSEAAIVTRLREAGALIVGKTVTTEFAYFEPGPTRNPHNLAHTPGGSSSGSAAAVAAGLAHLALGTQTVGSVIRPAAYCGIVGFKPSFGAVETAGLVTFSRSADHIGFFTATADEMLMLANAVMDIAPDEAGASERPRLAVPEGAYLSQSTALDIFEAQLYLLERAGYEVARIELLDDIAAVADIHQDMIAAELALEHAVWFDRYRELYRPRTAELILQGRTVTEERLREAREHRLEFRARLHSALEEAGADLWICPAAPDVAPVGLEVTGSPALNLPWTHAGLPAITLPAGRGMLGLPIGLQLVGRFGADARLLAWAAAMAPLFA